MRNCKLHLSKTLLIAVLITTIQDSPRAISGSDLFLSAKDGKVHREIDSPFHLKDPSNIFELDDQENRMGMLEFLETSLGDMRSELDEMMTQDDDEVDIEKIILQTNSDCVRAGDLYKKLNLFESVVLSLEDKGFKTEDFINTKRIKMPRSASLPSCMQPIIDDTTVETYKMFKSFHKKPFISVTPEPGIAEKITVGLTVSEYGFAVTEGLKANSSSWVLFNMAAFYYRITGDAGTGMECSRRAMHYAPSRYKDIALMNMASFLFRSDYPLDAIIATSIALDFSGDSVAVHTLRGFIFASISRFDKSTEAFSKAAQLGDKKTKLEKYGYAIQCHAKVHQGLSDQHEKLRDVIRQFELINLAVSDSEMFTSAILDAKISSVKVLLDSYNLKNIWRYPKDFSFTKEGYYSFGHDNSFSPSAPRWKSTTSLASPVGPDKFGTVSVPEIHIPLTDWPMHEECETHVRKDQVNIKPPLVIILLENKGFQFWDVVGQLAAPPGFPLPFCETEILHVPKVVLDMLKWARTENDKIFPDKDMQKVVRDYMGTCGPLEEFGRKLSLAHILHILPSWMFFNMAAVFWRAVGITSHAAECLTRAYYSTPSRYRDIVLINLSTFFSFTNETDSSLSMAKEAADVALEPATLYTIGILLAANGFLSLAIKNYRLALMQDLTFYPAIEALRIAECNRVLTLDSDSTSTARKDSKELNENVIEISIVDSRSGFRFIRSTSFTQSKADESTAHKVKVPLRFSTPEKKSKN